MANTYDIGDTVRCTGTFTSGGSAIDPTTVEARIRAPDYTISTYAYGTDAALVKDAVGAYHLDVNPNRAGVYYYRFEGTATASGAVEASFTVRPSVFY